MERQYTHGQGKNTDTLYEHRRRHEHGAMAARTHHLVNPFVVRSASPAPNAPVLSRFFVSRS
ncbi:hypothetical protein [Natrialba hulunbeirensis]|uniref:hypothetical protein n=1 Tax=Natrialba hulunbeirensis TaxID=123783 RepID=UPI000AD28B47|nr:hypothetical protein [Natrialba hulunbeirensis]